MVLNSQPFAAGVSGSSRRKKREGQPHPREVEAARPAGKSSTVWREPAITCNQPARLLLEPAQGTSKHTHEQT